MHFKILVITLFSFLLLTAGCQNAANQPAAGEVQRFELKGEVLAVDEAKKTASVKHEAIEGFMEAMTMDFEIREDWVWKDLKPGAEIRAELVWDKTNGEYWLEKIAILAAPDPNNPAPPVSREFAQVGQPIPEFSLTNQDNKKISPADFQGKALAITFIYSRCPLPEYCILMSKNFSDLAVELNKSDELKDQIRLLSISFDPETDTPEKLRQYGQGYLGKDAQPDFTVWQLATGTDQEVRKIADFFGLRYEIDEKDKTQFNHSLRTVVIGPDGKVKKVFAGNDWTPNELLGELKKTLQE